MAGKGKLTRTSGGTFASKLTPELTAVFAEAMAEGMYATDAAALAGVARTTVWRWFGRGERALAVAALAAEALPEGERPEDDIDLVPEEERVFADFWRQASAGEAKALKANLLIIQMAAVDKTHVGDWRAASWFLEHRFPASWGERNVRLKHSGADGGPVQVSWLEAVAAECAAEGDEADAED